MPANFSDTIRSLSLDRFRPSMAALVFVAVILILWLVWFGGARISVYEISVKARLEADASVHPVTSSYDGRVLSFNLTVGREVNAGDVLVEIESEAERLKLSEARTRLAMLSPQRAALQQQLKSEEDFLVQQLEAARIAVAEAGKRSEEADAAALYAKREADRLSALASSGLLSDAELSRARAEEQQRRAAADAVRLSISRLETELRGKEKSGQARLDGLRREIAAAESQAGAAASSIEQLSYEVERRKILAPVAGRIGESAGLNPGAVVHAGEKIGAIIPAGQVKLVAYFAPSSALGRVRPGQRARCRLEGFPWTQYGFIDAVVSSVSNEPRDGGVRVDLIIQHPSSSLIPLEHGLPGSVEVEVDRASPAALLFRAVGKRLSAPAEPMEAR